MNATLIARQTSMSIRCLGQQLLGNSLCLRTMSTSAKDPKRLNWQEYLAVRGSRRRWQSTFTIPCALLGFFGGATYFGTLETDPSKFIMGIDPFMFYGICTAGCMGFGALLGPTLGSAVWRTTHRHKLALIDEMDREFYKHIAKNRVDASLQSPTNPVPDYYGEKIGSLHQYRHWLRDQAKYKRKVLFPEE